MLIFVDDAQVVICIINENINKEKQLGMQKYDLWQTTEANISPLNVFRLFVEVRLF